MMSVSGADMPGKLTARGAGLKKGGGISAAPEAQLMNAESVLLRRGEHGIHLFAVTPRPVCGSLAHAGFQLQRVDGLVRAGVFLDELVSQSTEGLDVVVGRILPRDLLLGREGTEILAPVAARATTRGQYGGEGEKDDDPEFHGGRGLVLFHGWGGAAAVNLEADEGGLASGIKFNGTARASDDQLGVAWRYWGRLSIASAGGVRDDRDGPAVAAGVRRAGGWRSQNTAAAAAAAHGGAGDPGKRRRREIKYGDMSALIVISGASKPAIGAIGAAHESEAAAPVRFVPTSKNVCV